MGFAVDQNSGSGQNKNFLKNMIPGAHLNNSLYSDIPGMFFFFFYNIDIGTNINNLDFRS